MSTLRESGPLSLNPEPLAMSFTTEDVDTIIAELGASLTPSQYSAFAAAAHAALGNCSGPGAAYRILRGLQRNFFDPPSDTTEAHAPKHYRRPTKLTSLPPVAIEDVRAIGLRRAAWARR
jgi:hypothetical protein